MAVVRRINRYDGYYSAVMCSWHLINMMFASNLSEVLLDLRAETQSQSMSLRRQSGFGAE